MTTILVLLVCYVVSTAAFVCWIKTHSPEGYEDVDRGFIMTAKSPVLEAEVIRSDVVLVRKAWTAPRKSEGPLPDRVNAG